MGKLKIVPKHKLADNTKIINFPETKNAKLKRLVYGLIGLIVLENLGLIYFLLYK